MEAREIVALALVPNLCTIKLNTPDLPRIEIGFGRGQAMQVVDVKRALLPPVHSKFGGNDPVSVRFRPSVPIQEAEARQLDPFAWTPHGRGLIQTPVVT